MGTLVEIQEKRERKEKKILDNVFPFPWQEQNNGGVTHIFVSYFSGNMRTRGVNVNHHLAVRGGEKNRWGMKRCD